ncbi:carbon-nitrogen hydrolase [Aspergillus pseudoustus]|uniref:nitrilase n=1 Tax=Aspergillus pseudoustus TaxID=1810923 RepID=A0ABR4JD24_9EURO
MARMRWAFLKFGFLDIPVHGRVLAQLARARFREMNHIRAAVKKAGIFVVLGYSKRYQGSLYISQSFIDENGDIVHHRRKIKPTHVERGFRGEGQAGSLKRVIKSLVGNTGALNCWEHTQALLQYYEYAQDVDIHIASWPLIFNTCPEMQYHISNEMCGGCCDTYMPTARSMVSLDYIQDLLSSFQPK